MYFGHIRHIDDAERLYPPVIVRVLRHLAATDLAAQMGQRQHLDGDRIFYDVVDLKGADAAQARPESHKKYLDIHLVLAGRERMGIIQDDGRLPVTEDHFADRDIAFYDAAVADQCVLRLDPGHFVVVYPADIHRPACAEPAGAPIRKVVVKIDCALVGA
jgi:YhcH/YjgK/YiaL family protein